MILIRDILHCKPGKTQAVIEKFKAALPIIEREQKIKNARILVDYISTYWTVVLESEADSLETFEQQMVQYGQSPDFQNAVKGYMDFLEGGHREIFRIV